MRGKLTYPRYSVKSSRITPAHAGKTQRAQRANPALKDHPRACGENNIQRRDDTNELGSPPRMRGKLFLVPVCDGRVGITPAHAGKTFGISFPFDVYKDHPRACGENVYEPYTGMYGKGSPPRMRGKRKPLPLRRAAGRITPAHAGKTARA